MKFSKKLNNIIALYIIFLLVFSSIIIAPDEGEGMILDNFNNLENPSINDFNSMSGVDQGLYLATNYNQEYATSYYSDISNLGQNPDVDAQYFSDPNNIGKNPEADDAFFSGSYSEDNSLGNLRSNFENYKESASEYLTGKYGQTYVVSEVVEDFVYSADGVLINNGIEISLSEYQFDSTISEIRAVSSGFEIVKNDGQIISFSGDQAEGKGVSYNSEYGTVEVIGSDGHQTDGFLVNQGENVDDVNFDLSTNGKLSITGPVSGYLVEGNVRFNNRQGTLTISADRTFFEADNAEVITPSFYVDGQFRKEDNLVTTWSHGCTSCGNINDGETVFVDRTTDVGVITRGQNRNAGNQVEIHLDEISPNSEFYTSPDESSGEDVSEDARERARQVQPPQGDSNDGNAEVYIKKNYDTQEVIVYGSGPFEVAFHNVDPAGSATLDSTRSHFVGQNGMSGFDASFNPGTGDKINVRGQAEYSDLQYNLIDTKQNGASLRIERPTSFQEDSMVVDCVSCTVGSEVVSISKPMSLVQGGGGVYQAYQEIDSANFEISVVVDENGLGYSFSNTAVGELAKKQGDDNEVIMGRDLVMVVDSDENELTYFNIAHDSEGNAGGFVQVFDNTNFPENTLVSETRVDLGINGAIGDRQLIVSDEQYEQVQQVLTYIENSDFEGLAEAGIDIYDAEIRNLILSETYIDIDRVGEMGYIQQVTDAVDQRKQFLEYQQEVFDDYGILLDDNGLCVGSADICASIQDAILNQDEMAWYVTRAQGQALEAQNTFLEAQLDSGIVSPIDAEILIEANEEQIRDLQGVRAWMDSEVNTRLVLEGIQAGDVPEGSEDDISAVEDYNSKKRHWIGERIRLEYELTSLKAQVVETPSGVSETIEQDLIQSRIWELEDSIENIGISIANLDESTTKVAVQYAAERPDFAINLCSRSGSECAADLMEELEGTGIENSPLVQEAARDMVRFELNQNDDIVSARAYAETITDEQTRQEADELLVRHFNSQLDELQSDLAQEKRRLELEHEERFSGVLGGLEYITDKVIDPQSSIALAAEGAVTYVNIYGSIASLALGKDVCTDTSGPDCEGYQWKDGDYTTTYEEDKKILENSIASLEEDIQEIETTRFDVRYDTDLGGYGPFEERTIIGSSEELLDYHQVTNPSLRAILKQASGEELNNNDRVDIAIYNYNRERGEAAELLETIEYYEQNDPNFENRYGDKVTLIEQNIAHAEEFSLNLADNQFVTESLLAEGIRKAGSVDAFIPIASIGHVATSLARTTRVATTLSKVDDLATAGVRVLGSGLGDTTTSTLSKFVQGAGDVVTTPIDSTTYKLYMDLRTARNLEKSGARTIEDVELIQRAIDVNKYAKSQKSGVFTREVTDLFGKNKEIHDDLDTALKSFDLAADIGITSDDVDILLKAASDVQSLKLAKTGTKTVNTAAKFEDTARIERAEATDVMDTARRQAQGNAPESSLVVQSDAARSRALDVPENGPGTGNAIDDLAETTPSHSSMQTVFGGSTDETVQGLLDERGQLLIDGQPATSGGLVRGREIDYEIMRREFRGADGAVDLQDSRLIAMDGMSDSEGLARGFVRTGGNLELDTAYQVAKPEGSLVATFDEATTGFSVDRVVDDVPEVVSTAD